MQQIQKLSNKETTNTDEGYKRLQEVFERSAICDVKLDLPSDGLNETEYKQHIAFLEPFLFEKVKGFQNLEKARAIVEKHDIPLDLTCATSVSTSELEQIVKLSETTYSHSKGSKRNGNLEKAMALKDEHNLDIDFASLDFNVSDNDLAAILEHVEKQKKYKKTPLVSKALGKRKRVYFTINDMFNNCEEYTLQCSLDQLKIKDTLNDKKKKVDFLEKHVSSEGFYKTMSRLKGHLLKAICESNGVSKSGKNKDEHIGNLLGSLQKSA